MGEQLDRAQAWVLLTEFNQDPFHLHHARTVEGVMRYFAQELGYGDEVDFWGIVGLLCLLSILPIDGVLLKWLHRGIGALIGKGAYVMPFALIGIAVLLFARPKGPVRLRGTCIALMPLLIGSIIHAFSCANEYDLSMSTLSGLLSTGMEGSSGGLLGGDIMCALTHYEEYVRCCIENGADLIISGAGLPTDLPKYTAGSSIKLAPIVSPPRTAKVLLKLWDNHYHRVPDLVVIEGPAAGGHLGYSAETVEETARRGYDDEIREILQIVHGYEEKYACTIPVVFAGGVYTHEDILHYLSLGCAGVQMATRFVVTEECDADPRYKQAYLNAKKEDITIMHSPVGMPGRAIRNPFLTEREQEREKISHCYQCLKKCDKASIPYCITTALTRAADGDTDNALLFCGENAWRLDHMTTVPELMAELAGESLPDSKKQKI